MVVDSVSQSETEHERKVREYWARAYDTIINNKDKEAEDNIIIILKKKKKRILAKYSPLVKAYAFIIFTRSK